MPEGASPGRRSEAEERRKACAGGGRWRREKNGAKTSGLPCVGLRVAEILTRAFLVCQPSLLHFQPLSNALEGQPFIQLLVKRCSGGKRFVQKLESLSKGFEVHVSAGGAPARVGRAVLRQDLRPSEGSAPGRSRPRAGMGTHGAGRGMLRLVPLGCSVLLPALSRS